MAAALEAAGILESWAETLHQQILEVAEINRRAGMTASEAESEARRDMIPCSWEQQEAWLAGAALDYEPQNDPDLYAPDEDDDDFPDSHESGAIPLLQADQGELETIKGKLSQAIWSVLKTRELTADVLMELGAVLWLVERLPEHHDSYTGRIDLNSKYGDDTGWLNITFDEQGLSFQEGEIIRGEYGSDHSSRIVYQATPSGSYTGDLDFDLAQWLVDFAESASDPDVELTVEWYPDLEMPTQQT